MNLTIDLGNTLAKVGIFDNHQLQEMRVVTTSDEVHAIIKNFPGGNFIISSVNQDSASFLSSAKHFQKAFVLLADTPIPLIVKYSTPETLGVDRIAAVCGARDSFPGKNCLVIDAGTCITCEFVDSDGVYWGGSISPGLHMRFKAMNTFTARLPLVEPVDHPMFTGNSTASCMQTGVIAGLIDELNGAIQRYSEKYADLKVILTGGDSRFFENKLKAPIFAVPELVLRGLNSILLYNIRD
jgi:type III pantothenate kinase